MSKIDKLTEKAKTAAKVEKYALMGWAILEDDDLWTARLDVWSGRPSTGESIMSKHDTLDECMEAVHAMIDQYPPKSKMEKVQIIIDDMRQ